MKITHRVTRRFVPHKMNFVVKCSSVQSGFVALNLSTVFERRGKFVMLIFTDCIVKQCVAFQYPIK